MLERANAFIAANKDQVNPRYRPRFHAIQPIGWIGDPNGFHFDGEYYHLFYRYALRCPLGRHALGSLAQQGSGALGGPAGRDGAGSAHEQRAASPVQQAGARAALTFGHRGRRLKDIQQRACFLTAQD